MQDFDYPDHASSSCGRDWGLRNGVLFMLVLFHGLIGGGCADGIFSDASPDDDAPTSLAVVDNTEWELAPLGAGPWPLPSEDRIYCEEDGYGYEKPVFEILTDLCDGRVFRQELQIDMKREDYLHVVFWHSALVFDEPATAEEEAWRSDPCRGLEHASRCHRSSHPAPRDRSGTDRVGELCQRRRARSGWLGADEQVR